MSGDKAFFIDKDGTLVDNSGYPKIIPSDKIMKERVVNGLRKIQEKGYKMILVSNQPWIAKKRMSQQEVDKIFLKVIADMKEEGINITDYIYCPHQRTDNCNCKKPKSEMLFKMAQKHNLDLKESFMMGDSSFDISCGKNAGTKTVLILSGEPKPLGETYGADYTINNVNGVVELI